MISKEKLYNATEDGLQIFEMHIPDIRHYAGKKKPFKLRRDERTPSAYLQKRKVSDGYEVWHITDFGGDGRAVNPIQYHMDQTGKKFAEAMVDLASRFNVSDELDRTVNKPDIRKRPANADEPDGSCSWEIDQEFTDYECGIMGPRVTPDHLKSLNWYRVKSITTVKNRQALVKYSNEHYPIFMRECWFEADGKKDRFYKVYEPLNCDKGFRFQYQPAGRKPQRYTNGLQELRAAWKEFNDREEKSWNSDPMNEGKPYKEQKLGEAIICSGERDAICVKAFGYFPIWFNSETYVVSEEEMREISRYVETVYNIPDIDETGKRKGRELALRFIDVHTIWLPEKLREYKDARGNPCKDLRDWCKYNKDIRSFRNLLELGTPAKFWSVHYGKNGEAKYTVDSVSLIEFLALNNIHVYEDPLQKESAKLIKIENNIVSQIYPRQIRLFVYNWAVETSQPRGLRNHLLRCPELAAVSLDVLRPVRLNFCNHTTTSQFFFFPEYAVEVKADKIIKYDKKEGLTDRYVWEENVIKHKMKIREDRYFEITHPEGKYASEDFDINILSNKSNTFKVLINSSRIYWRKELEEYADSLGEDGGERYRKEHKFDIAGEGLSQEEIQEQKQCLINKIFTIGYLLHKGKELGKAWAPFVMDSLIGVNDQCNGRSGKSFMFNAVAHLTPMLKLNGRNEKLMTNQFWLERVTKDTGVVYLDDAAEYFPLKEMYGLITSDLTVNPKNQSSFQLNFFEAPKFALSTNYVPRDFDSSTIGRLLFCVNSDYYHLATEENDYRETRSIADDFGMQLMNLTYPESEWEADINFMLQCLQFYLSLAHTPAKIEPKIGNIIFRRYLREMSDNFRDWAEMYFSPDSGNLDKNIIRETAFEEYKKYSGAHKTTMKSFTKSLKAFCYTCEHIEELNPEDVCNSNGNRILKRIEDADGNKKQTDMIYVRSKPEFREKEPDHKSTNPFADDSDILNFF